MIFTVVNFLATTIGMVMLVDRKGRKFLLVHGHVRRDRVAAVRGRRCSGKTEKLGVDCQSRCAGYGQDRTRLLRLPTAQNWQANC